MREIQAQEKSHSSYESVLGGGDGAVLPRFGIAFRFEDGDDGFCFMNVESEVRVSLMRLSSFSFLLQWMLDRFRSVRDSPRFEPDASLFNQLTIDLKRSAGLNRQP